MGLYQPLKTFSYYRFASQYAHNWLTMAKDKGYNITKFCKVNNLNREHIYNLRNGSTLFPITLHYLNRIAGTLGATFDEVAFYHLKGCECGCNPLNGDAKGYKHKPAKRKKK